MNSNGFLNILDVAILLTLLWNVLRGFGKGFLEEILSIVGILISIFLSVELSHPLAIIISGSPKSVGFIGITLCGLFLYLIFYLVFKFIAYKINAMVSKGRFGIVNNIFGFLFGIFRGIILSSALILFTGVLVPNSWIVKGSKLGKYLIPVANVFADKIPHHNTAGKTVLENWEQSKANFLHKSKPRQSTPE